MAEANATGGAPPAAAAAVRVLAVSRVAPAPAGRGAAADPVVVKLSFLDTPWVVMPSIQRVFLYELPGRDGDGEFAAAVARLKHSLAATLSVYLPMAGKLAYVASTGDVAVDCDDDPGVAFVEAEAGVDSGMDVRRLAGDEAHDIPAFLALVPDLPTKVLPAPVLAVQATHIPGGGLALGLTVHHAVADGQAVWRFMAAWASAALDGSPVTKSLPAPHYGREAIHVPTGDETARQMLKMIAPNLPVVSNVADHAFGQRFRLERRTFYLSGDDIQALKRRIDALAAAEDDVVAADGSYNSNGTSAEAAPTTHSGSSSSKNPKPVSTFVALSALGWTSFVRSKGLAAGDDTYLFFFADLRARLDPPVRDGYLGNCIKGCLASADAGDLVGSRGLLAASRAVQAAVAEMEAAPLAGAELWFKKMIGIPMTRFANVAASPRFRVYESSDFGFGRPARVELVSMNRDGEMLLVGGRDHGEVQLSVSLDPARMDEFKAHVFGSSEEAN